MFLKRLWVIYESIRTITRVIPTGEQKDLAKTRFIRKLMALPSERWGWWVERLYQKKVNKSLTKFLKLSAKNYEKNWSLNHEATIW